MILKHVPTGNVGTLIKEYTPTGGALTVMIRLENGRFFYAPYCEFTTI